MLGDFVPGMNILITAEVTGAIKQIKMLNGELEKTKLAADSTGSSMLKLNGYTKFLIGTGAAVAGAFSVIGYEAIKTSLAVEGSMAKMNAAFAATGSNLNSQSAIVEKSFENMANLGFTAKQTADALARGAISFHSATTAMNYMGLAADIARARGIDMTEAMVILGRASTGVFRGLSTLGVTIPQVGTTQEKFKNVIDQLTQSVKNQADAYAQTHPLEVMKAKTEEVANSFGQLLLPAFRVVTNWINTKLLPALLNVVNYLRQHPVILQTLANIWITVLKILKPVSEVFLTVAEGALQLAKGIIYADMAISKFLKDNERVAADKSIINWLNGATDGLVKFRTSIANAKTNYVEFKKEAQISFVPSTGNLAGGLLGAGGLTGTQKLASDIENNFDAMAKAVDNVIKSMSKITSYDLAGRIKSSFADPLTTALNKLQLANKNYATEQNKLIDAQVNATRASLEHAKALNLLNKATKDNEAALTATADVAKNAAKIAGEAAQAQAQATDDALKEIISAQEDYANEVLARVSGFRDAFARATKIDLGGMASNIAQAKQQVSDAEAALKAAQDKFAATAKLASYSGVTAAISVPLFTAEEQAVAKAKRDLQIALGQETNPFAATAQELLTPLQNQYQKATDLSKNAGQLASAGFSQDFITQILDSGLDMGNALSTAILTADTQTQSAWIDVYKNLDNISKHGVDDLAVTLNKGAIDAMSAFIQGFSVMQDPLNKLLQSIQASVAAMAGTIADAIAKLTSQLASQSALQAQASGAAVVPVVPTFTAGGDETSDAARIARSMGNYTINITQTDPSPDKVSAAVSWANKTSLDYLFGSSPTVTGPYGTPQISARGTSTIPRTSVTSGSSLRGD